MCDTFKFFQSLFTRQVCELELVSKQLKLMFAHLFESWQLFREDCLELGHDCLHQHYLVVQRACVFRDLRSCWFDLHSYRKRGLNSNH